MKTDISKNLTTHIAMVLLAGSTALEARVYTVSQNNTANQYGENVHYSWGSADSSRDYADIKNSYWNNELTPIDVIFAKGQEADQTGEFYFTTLTIGGTAELKSALILRDGVRLNLSSYMDVDGKFSASNADVSAAYLDVSAFGSFNMKGGSLTLTGGATGITYKIAGSMKMEDVAFTTGNRLLIDGGNYGGVTYNDADVIFSGTTNFTGTDIVVEGSNKLSVTDAATVRVDSLNASNLKVSESAEIFVSSANDLSVENLSIILDGIEPVNFSDIFKADDGTSIAFSADNTNISVMDQSGTIYQNVDFAYDDNGNITGITAVPEPAVYAVAFAVAALGLAAYCRRG